MKRTPVVIFVLSFLGGSQCAGQPASNSASGRGEIVPNPTNKPPVITIIAPAAGEILAGSDVMVAADASDPEGRLRSVTFNIGGPRFGNRALDTSPPYQTAFTNLPSGPYRITAWAVDDKNLRTEAVPVSFSVISPPPRLSEPTLLSTGEFQFRVTGTPNEDYQIENANSPMGPWRPVASIRLTTADQVFRTRTRGISSALYFRIKLSQ